VWEIEDSRAGVITSLFPLNLGYIAPICFAMMDLHDDVLFPPLGPALANVFVHKRRNGNAAPRGETNEKIIPSPNTTGVRMANGCDSDCGHHNHGFPAPSIDVTIQDDPAQGCGVLSMRFAKFGGSFDSQISCNFPFKIVLNLWKRLKINGGSQ
jgi:hypothetical protein